VYLKIAIDGPAAAGKSTVAKAVASKIGYTYIDTGAMYRAVTLLALRHSIDLHNEKSLVEILKDNKILVSDNRVFINEEDVSSQVRSQEIANNVSIVGALPMIRDFMLHLQRDLAEKGCVVMEGRDIGTVVLPDAQLKIFITASPESRALRRKNDDKSPELQNIPLSVIVDEIEKRDKMDSKRKIAPLKKAKDAIVIDTTDLTVEQVVTKIVNLIYDKLNNNNKGVV